MTMRKNHDIIDIDGKLLRETDLAFLIESGAVRGWCPKSETEDNHDGSFFDAPMDRLRERVYMTGKWTDRIGNAIVTGLLINSAVCTIEGIYCVREKDKKGRKQR